MKKLSTLIFLVNSVKSELINAAPVVFPVLKEEELLENDFPVFSEPPQVSVNAILSYARSLELEHTEMIGGVEWVLN